MERPKCSRWVPMVHVPVCVSVHVCVDWVLCGWIEHSLSEENWDLLRLSCCCLVGLEVPHLVFFLLVCSHTLSLSFSAAHTLFPSALGKWRRGCHFRSKDWTPCGHKTQIRTCLCHFKIVCVCVCVCARVCVRTRVHACWLEKGLGRVTVNTSEVNSHQREQTGWCLHISCDYVLHVCARACARALICVTAFCVHYSHSHPAGIYCWQTSFISVEIKCLPL